jgi:hypothetical protein
VGAYTKAEIDEQHGALANLTYGDACWFGRTQAGTPWEAGERNGFDFTTNTPWEWAGTQWAEGTPIDVINGSTVGISSQFLDIAEAGLPGLARYSMSRNAWDYYPNQYNSMDPAIFEQNAAGEETIKAGSILPEHLAESSVTGGLSIIGEYRHLSFQPTPLELAEWRLLELKYQIIEIALYPELCARKYVGDDTNDTADWWYKCDDDGTRNVNGLYMRVEDPRGLFFRNAGQNSLKTAADGTPYDGGEIGSFHPDTIIAHTHHLYALQNAAISGYFNVPTSGSYAINSQTLTGDPTQGAGYETTPAWIAGGVYIVY